MRERFRGLRVNGHHTLCRCEDQLPGPPYLADHIYMYIKMKVPTFRSFLVRAATLKGSSPNDVPGPVSSAEGSLSTIPPGVATAWTTPVGSVTSRFVSSVSVDGDASVSAQVSRAPSPPVSPAPSPPVSPVPSPFSFVSVDGGATTSAHVPPAPSPSVSTPSPPVSPTALSYRNTSSKQNSSSSRLV